MLCRPCAAALSRRGALAVHSGGAARSRTCSGSPQSNELLAGEDAISSPPVRGAIYCRLIHPACASMDCDQTRDLPASSGCFLVHLASRSHRMRSVSALTCTHMVHACYVAISYIPFHQSDIFMPLTVFAAFLSSWVLQVTHSHLFHLLLRRHCSG